MKLVCGISEDNFLPNTFMSYGNVILFVENNNLFKNKNTVYVGELQIVEINNKKVNKIVNIKKIQFRI